MRVEGKVALVTGAAQGIGRGVTEKLLKFGAKWVTIVDFDKAKGQEAEAQLTEIYGKDRVGFVWCDVTFYDRLSDAFHTTYKRHNQLDIVINNAAVAEGPEISWDAVVLATYLGVVRGVRLAKQYMSTENGGSGGVVINTASVNGIRKSWTPIYGSCKAAVINFTRCLPGGDSDFSQGGMRVGAICPGYVETVNGKAGNARLKPGDKAPLPVPLDDVVDGFFKIIDDDSMNGTVMTCTLAGNHPWTFQSNEEIDQKLKMFEHNL